MDRIELQNFEFQTIVGILDREQRSPQPLACRIAMELPLEHTARTGDLAGSINYAAVQQWVMFLAQIGRWPLIESLSHAIARAILAAPVPCEGRAQICAVEVELRKPTILTGAIPGIVIRREAAWCDLQERQEAPGVVVGVLEETPRRTAKRAVLAPGAQWAVPAHLGVLVVGGGGHGADPTTALQVGTTYGPGEQASLAAGPDGLAVLLAGVLDG